MLGLFLGEAQQVSEPGLIAVNVLTCVIQNHGNDEFLNEREDVAVAVAADLVERPLFVLVQASDIIYPGDPIRQEPFGKIEVSALKAIFNRPGAFQRAF